ncbi:MAG: pyridoxamine 5'-phosphate oxidase family protein [Prevotellaceae bacterium]|jgi:uncharacterized protein YhbP (UPF0306 family)|nr:pyridoxamine 5'-phosphate oxidase family protein [Prevotellaceae bacterium]
MQDTDSQITAFLNEHHVLTLATCVNGVPWCASMFYVYLETERMFVFTSDYQTHHIQDIKTNDRVAGTVVLETRKIGLLRGVQFQGRISEPQGTLAEKAKRAYLVRYPYALLKPAPLWVVELHIIKYTDNRLGFGKKLLWQKTS